MKLELTNKIQAVIDEYQKNAEVHNQAMKDVVNPYKISDNAKRYTKDGLRLMINEEIYDIMTDWKNTDTILNQKISEIIAGAKEKFMKEVSIDKTKGNATDYSLKINNAIQFLKAELETAKYKSKLEDDVAVKIDTDLHHILKDFVDDYDTMKMFKTIIETKIKIFERYDGTSFFPQTFGKYQRFESIMNSFEELENLASKVFLFERTADGSLMTVNNLTFSMYIDGYQERLTERLMVDTATVIDSRVEEID